MHTSTPRRASSPSVSKNETYRPLRARAAADGRLDHHRLQVGGRDPHADLGLRDGAGDELLVVRAVDEELRADRARRGRSATARNRDGSSHCPTWYYFSVAGGHVRAREAPMKLSTLTLVLASLALASLVVAGCAADTTDPSVRRRRRGHGRLAGRAQREVRAVHRLVQLARRRLRRVRRLPAALAEGRRHVHREGRLRAREPRGPLHRVSVHAARVGRVERGQLGRQAQDQGQPDRPEAVAQLLRVDQRPVAHADAHALRAHDEPLHRRQQLRERALHGRPRTAR